MLEDDFLNSVEALEAKKEVENGELQTFNSLEEFNEWLKHLSGK